MNRKRFSGALIALATLTIVSPASANCAIYTTIGTYGSAGYVYWQPAPGDDLTGARLTGRFWQLGNRAAGNEGACRVPTGNGTAWLYFEPSGIFMFLSLDDPCVAGCPRNLVVTVAENVKADGTGASFLAATVDETPPVPTNFDYSPQGNLHMRDIPTPQVTVASQVANTVNLSVTIASPAAGVYGPGSAAVITGVKLVRATGASDPGRAAASWTQTVGTSTGSGPATFSLPFDCSTGTPYRIATQILFDSGASQVASD